VNPRGLATDRIRPQCCVHIVQHAQPQIGLLEDGLDNEICRNDRTSIRG
jgi:hypothetical protein